MEKKYTAMIVDDDKFLLDMYRKKFESRGVSVDVSTTPLEALEKLRTDKKFDILVFDIIMPGMDGLELLETVRKEKLNEGSVIVMLTNEGDSAKIEKARSLGVDGYIVKATSIPSEVVEEVLKIADSKIH
jgi:two-component system, chemotaxis family, sensor kinase CheA